MSIYLRGSTYWMKHRIAGKIVRRSCRTKDHSIAVTVEADAQASADRINRLSESSIRNAKEAIDPNWDNPMYLDMLAHKLHKSASARAKRNDLEYSLSKSFILQLLIGTGGRCSVSDMPFELTRLKAVTSANNALRAHPFQPSIDRILSGKGYTESNTRIVCYSVNVALNQWGENILIRIAEGIVAKRYAVEGHNMCPSENQTECTGDD